MYIRVSQCDNQLKDIQISRHIGAVLAGFQSSPLSHRRFQEIAWMCCQLFTFMCNNYAEVAFPRATFIFILAADLSQILLDQLTWCIDES